MFNFGGGFGGFPGMQDDDEGEINNTKLYEDLGIAPSATAAEIKKAYRQAAMKHHPDKGGDPEKVDTIDCLFVDMCVDELNNELKCVDALNDSTLREFILRVKRCCVCV